MTSSPFLPEESREAATALPLPWVLWGGGVGTRRGSHGH